MATVRVMFVGQGQSDEPEDRVVNTFHFHDITTSYAAVADDLRQAVIDFYITHTSGGNTLGNFISAWINRAAQVVSYDLTTATPRVPTAQSFNLSSATGVGLPEEVAICCTLHGAPPVTPRRRGRIYVGPLANLDTVVAGGSQLQETAVANGSAAHVTQCIARAAEGLIAASGLIGCPWSIRSTRPSENFVTIEGGWIDDRFDTIRRRGPAPINKYSFPV